MPLVCATLFIFSVAEVSSVNGVKFTLLVPAINTTLYSVVSELNTGLSVPADVVKLERLALSLVLATRIKAYFPVFPITGSSVLKSVFASTCVRVLLSPPTAACTPVLSVSLPEYNKALAPDSTVIKPLFVIVIFPSPSLPDVASLSAYSCIASPVASVETIGSVNSRSPDNVASSIAPEE